MIHVMISCYIAIYEYHILYGIDMYLVCMISWSEQKKKGGAWLRVRTSLFSAFSSPHGLAHQQQHSSEYIHLCIQRYIECARRIVDCFRVLTKVKSAFSSPNALAHQQHRSEYLICAQDFENTQFIQWDHLSEMFNVVLCFISL